MNLTTPTFSLLILFSLGCGSPNPTPSTKTTTTPTTPTSSITPNTSVITPFQAIQDAASNPLGITGVFELQIRNTGEAKENHKGFIFLNSEIDYRDQRCLTIRIPPNIVSAYKRINIDPLTYFTNKTIRVTGTAKRVKIDFISDNGLPSGKYYYQTHVQINAPWQIKIAD